MRGKANFGAVGDDFQLDAFELGEGFDFGEPECLVLLDEAY
jgi:hypothetical protein